MLTFRHYSVLLTYYSLFYIICLFHIIAINTLTAGGHILVYLLVNIASKELYFYSDR